MRRPKFDSQLVERGDGFTLREWRAALDGRVKCGPKRPEVDRGPRGLAADEFGGHIRRRANEVTVPAARMSGVAVRLGNTEVDQNQVTITADQQVGRLHVTVHDSGGVHGSQRSQQLVAQRGDDRWRRFSPALNHHWADSAGKREQSGNDKVTKAG